MAANRNSSFRVTPQNYDLYLQRQRAQGRNTRPTTPLRPSFFGLTTADLIEGIRDNTYRSRNSNYDMYMEYMELYRAIRNNSTPAPAPAPLPTTTDDEEEHPADIIRAAMDPETSAETVEWMWAMKPPSYKEAQENYYKNNPGLPQYEEAIKLNCEWTPSVPLNYEEVMDLTKDRSDKPQWDMRSVPSTFHETINPELYDNTVIHNMTSEELVNFDMATDYENYCAAIVPMTG
jgi:hypothetical protein